MVRRYRVKNINMAGESEIKNQRFIIWGISVSGLEAVITLSERGAETIGFTDSYVSEEMEGREFAGQPVYSFDQIKKMSDINVYVSTIREEYLFDILEKTDQLEGIKIYCGRDIYGPGLYNTEKLSSMISDSAEIIDVVRKTLCDNKSVATFDNLLQYRMTNDRKLLADVYEDGHDQYFPDSTLLTFGKDEIFVDAGAYNGDTSYNFMRFVGKYDKIYLMEPDDRLFYITKEYVRIKGLNNTSVIKKGAYSQKGVVKFQNNFESGSSNISVNGDEEIETISIDEMLAGERASYIKMDIEGAEKEALEGCAYTIDKYHPKLAISIYHKEDDLWLIPYYLIKRYPFYRFSMRHYSKITTETVLYAAP